MIQVHFSVLFISALLLLVLPLKWVLAMIAAAVVHEMMHLICLYLLGGNVLGIDVQAGGCRIRTAPLEEWKQFISILAGPLGSLLLLLFSEISPETAVCGLVQGFYNLIPVRPLDGGRLLDLVLSKFSPIRKECVMKWIAVGTCIAADILAIWVSLANSGTVLPLLAALAWNIRAFPRKTPCKPSEIGVQYIQIFL